MSLDTSQFRSPVNPHQPHRQSPIYLRDTPVSQQSSTRPKGSPFPTSRRDLGVHLQGVRANSQISTPCYTAKQDSIVDEQDDHEQSPPSPSGTDMEQPPDQEPLNIMVLTKEFDPDLVELGKDFTSEENRAKREAYKANYTRDQKEKVYDAWVLFMREISRNVPFFIYFERYYGQHKQFCASTKTWTLVESNPTRNEISNPTPRQPLVKSLPTNPSHSKDKTALEIVVQKLGELAKKPAVPLPKSPSQLKVIKLRTTPSSSSSDTEKESLEAKRARQRLKKARKAC